MAVVLLSLQSPPNADTAAGSSADAPPLSVFPPPPQRRPGPDTPRRGIPLDQWPEVLRRSEQGESLRQIAHSYGVSHETVRRTLKAARKRGGEVG